MENNADEKALARMTPIISHEIRNPLAVIGNSVYFIKTKLGPDADPKVQRHVGIIESEVRRANETLVEIISYTRMPEPKRAPGRLNALVEETLAGVPLPEGVRAKLALSKDDPKPAFDPELMRQALRHVLRNAAEALAPGPAAPKSPSLTVTTGLSDGEAFIEVSDNGPGLAPEIAKELFRPFTTNRPRGIGLGLAYARKVLLRHGGAIEHQGSPGGGCRFRLTLPAGNP